jgi:ABC-type Mn2+/Zn2+ transport system permease subunit
VLEPFSFPFVQRGLAEIVLLSLAAGLLGSWVVLRGLAFFTHAVGHGSFPGLVLASGLGLPAPLCALVVGLLFAGGLQRLSRAQGGAYDVVTALLLIGALAVGVILASDVFHSGSDVETLLFGSLLAVGIQDLALAGGVGLVALVASACLDQAWLATGFDQDSARQLGLRSAAPDAALLFLIALSAIAALSAIGVLLVPALFVVPAATARLWARSLRGLQASATLLVAAEGTAGLWLSVQTNAPPGATIAVLTGVVFAAATAARVLVPSLTASRETSSSR